MCAQRGTPGLIHRQADADQGAHLHVLDLECAPIGVHELGTGRQAPPWQTALNGGLLLQLREGLEGFPQEPGLDGGAVILHLQAEVALASPGADVQLPGLPAQGVLDQVSQQLREI